MNEKWMTAAQIKQLLDIPKKFNIHNCLASFKVEKKREINKEIKFLVNHDILDEIRGYYNIKIGNEKYINSYVAGGGNRATLRDLADKFSRSTATIYCWLNLIEAQRLPDGTFGITDKQLKEIEELNRTTPRRIALKQNLKNQNCDLKAERDSLKSKLSQAEAEIEYLKKVAAQVADLSFENKSLKAKIYELENQPKPRKKFLGIF